MRKIYILPAIILILAGLYGGIKFQQYSQAQSVREAVTNEIPMLKNKAHETLTKSCGTKVPGYKNCILLQYKVSEQECLKVQEHLKIVKKSCGTRADIRNAGQEFAVITGGVYEEPAKYGQYIEIYFSKPYFLSEWL